MAKDHFAVPVSFAQERLWFLNQFEPGQSTYNIPVALHLTGQTSRSGVLSALNDLVQRHESLRTHFGLIDDAPMQIIQKKMDVNLGYIDLSELPTSERFTASRKHATDDACKPFDLSRGPLLRATLVRLDELEYVLLLTLHHIISDLWSTSVLLDDLSALLDHHLRGTRLDLPLLPIQYADFSVWQRQRLSGDHLASLVKYWREQLQDAPLESTFPPDHPRPSRQSYHGRTLFFDISSDVRDDLVKLCRSEGLTLFMGLLACFDLVLSMYSGSRDVVVGTPIANRTRPEVEKLIGFFVNTLVLRTSLEGDPTFRELLRRVSEMTLEAYDHQDLPFEKLVSELHVERRVNASPLFQTLFGLQTVQQGGSALNEGDSAWGEISTGTAKFDVTVLIKEVKDGLKGGFEYATDLYEQQTIQSIIEHFKRCMEVAVNNPDWKLSEIASECIPIEQSRLIGPSQQLGIGSCIELFNQQAFRAGQSPALVLPDGNKVSYMELVDLSDRFAGQLVQQGIEVGDLVGIALERSVTSVVAVLGILKAGGAYVPLDPDYPVERLRYMLSEAHPAGVVCSEDFLTRIGAEQINRIELNLEALEESSFDAGALPVLTASDLAYVIFTSGSTGRPKGVTMPHGPLANLISWQIRGDKGEARTTMHLAPLAFDVSFQELFSTLCAGGSVVLCHDELRRDPGRLLSWAASQQVQRIYLPPALLQLLADTVSHDEWPPDLTEIITAGEALRITSSIRRLLKSIGTGILRNQYGPTETHVVCEHTMIFDQDCGIPESPPIGVPISNAVVYVLNDDLTPLPRGARGELYIGGPVLATGYLHMPEETADRFLLDPFQSGEHLMYKTGDLARIRFDGTLEFLGRTDDQLKIRGYRVEPGEIETALEQLPEVKNAVVKGLHGSDNGNVLLAAFVIWDAVDPVDEAVLKNRLRESVPAWMIPDRIIATPSLPLLPNGKINRLKLTEFPLPELDRGQQTPPRTMLERALAELWVEVLTDVENVGIDDSFFDIGGHSIAVVQMAARVRERMGVEIPLTAFFKADTIEAQAKMIVYMKASQVEYSEVLRALAVSDEKGMETNT